MFEKKTYFAHTCSIHGLSNQKRENKNKSVKVFVNYVY